MKPLASLLQKLRDRTLWLRWLQQLQSNVADAKVLELYNSINDCELKDLFDEEE